MIDDSNSFVHNVIFRINKRFKSQSIHEIILLLFKKGVHFSHSRGANFKIFRPVGPNHGGASLVTEPQPPQSQKCGYGPAIMYKLKKCFFSISTNILIKFLLKICALLKFYLTPGKLGRYNIIRNGLA